MTGMAGYVLALHRTPFLLLAALLIPTIVCAADFTGPVVSILDGDTLEVLHTTHPERICLSGIDCPEKGQAFGNNAKHVASDLAFGKDVTIQTHGHDKYKRTLGDVILSDGINLNQELVKQGWCWWYRKYAPGDMVLEGLGAEAREGRKGLWADPAPIPPWEWRSGVDERRLTGRLLHHLSSFHLPRFPVVLWGKEPMPFTPVHFGPWATLHAVADFAFHKEVTAKTHGYDKYKRTLGDMTLPDGMNLNQELVKQAGGIGDMRLATRSWRS